MGRWLRKDALKERRKLVVKLVDEDGISFEDVAQRLGIASGSVRRDYRIYRKTEWLSCN